MIMVSIPLSRARRRDNWYVDCQFWCIDRFGEVGAQWDTKLGSDHIEFTFENDADATMFALRWVK